MERSSKIIAAGALLAGLAAFLVYLPALGNGFVNWDDHAYVYANEHIRSFDAWWLATAGVAGNWHPLTMLSFTADYAFWGDEPFGYHLVNNLLHAVNTSLVFLLAARLYAIRRGAGRGAMYAGVTAAVLFGLHPLHVESVAWVSERKDVLFFFFYALSVLSYLGYASAGPRSRGVKYAAAFLFFVLSMLSKPMAISLPFVLLIIDLYPLGRLAGAKAIRAAVVEKIPFFAISAALGLVTVFSQEQAIASAGAVAFKVRLFTAIRGYAFYLYKTFVPMDLAPYYPLFPNADIYAFEYLASLILLIVITGFCALAFRRTKFYSALWLFYAVTLFPVSGVLQVGGQAAADRYAYLPGLAPVLLIAVIAARLIEGGGRVLRAVFVSGLIAVTAVLSLLTVGQSAVWKDSLTLWSHEIELYPIVFAYRNRAAEYKRLSMTEKEIGDYTVVISSGGQPDLDQVYISRATAYKKLGDNASALEDLDLAIGFKASVAALNNRGNLYRESGNPRRAIEDFSRAVEIDPANASVYFNMALAYIEAGDKEGARMNFMKAAGLGLKAAEEYINRDELRK